MEKSKSLDDNYFIKNAILCWLHHYGDKVTAGMTIYKELAQRDTYINMEPNDAKPAKPRRRKPVVTAN